MSAGVFILILVVAIAALVLMIVKAKMHPVLALFIAALGTGIALGYGVTGSVDYISNGFGGTLGSVGITIILGAIISMAIEDTGAAKVIANFFIKLFRGKRMELAPALTAFIMSIPVFGDITMVLTAPIASMLSNKWVARGLVVCLSPLLITAMGGAFGNVLKNSPALEPLSKLIADSPIPAILVPWAIAAIMMTSVGSMTTAGMTAAAIVLPMMPDLGLSSLAAVLAIGSGTLMGNHYNNSGFWVMGQFFHLNTKQSVKYVTVPCAVASVICLIAVVILNAVRRWTPT